MTKTVVVVDYGMGNLRSVSQAVEAAAQGSAYQVVVSASPAAVRAAHRVVLPGQGAMPDCMRELREAAGGDLMQAVLDAAANKPLFGVCVGMQMLLDQSDESATTLPTPALGLIPGYVKKFELHGQTQADGSRYKVPQMGWNTVQHTRAHPLWAGIANHSYFYFVHSFYAQPFKAEHTAGQTSYGNPFSCAIARDNIFATQFHPEKSAAAGLRLYQNFLNWKI